MTARKINLLIKFMIVVTVLALVLVYMFTMRANAGTDSENGNKSGAYSVNFFVDGEQFDSAENKGAETVLPVPKKEKSYFTGWYLDPECKDPFVPGESSGINVAVYAGFKSFSSVINEFLQTEVDMKYQIPESDYSIKYDSERDALLIKNINKINYTVVKVVYDCTVWYDLSLKSGKLEIISGQKAASLQYRANIDYSELTFDAAVQTLKIDEASLEISESEGAPADTSVAEYHVLPELCSQFTGALELLIRELAVKNSYSF